MQKVTICVLRSQINLALQRFDFDLPLFAGFAPAPELRGLPNFTLPPGPLKLEHIGIAVHDAAEVAQLYATLLGESPYKQEAVAREGVRTHFIAAGTAKLELLEALGPDSPVAKYLDRRGQGLHHLAFEVADINVQMQRLREQGLPPLSDTPRPGADGKLIFFLHPKDTHGVLVEFCQSTPTPLEETRIPFHEEHLAVYERGASSNPALVVLHGAAGSITLQMEPLLRRLEQQFYVLGLDFTGHGASGDLAEEPLSTEIFVENVLAVLDAFELEGAHLFGHSMGGSIALVTALRHRSRVRRIVAHAANLHWTSRMVRQMRLGLAPETIRRHSPERIQALDAAHGAGRWPHLNERVVGYLETLPSRSPTAETLRQIPHPTLLTTGDRDALFPLKIALSLHELLPNSHFAVLPDTGHPFAELDLDTFIPLLSRHLLGSESPRP